MKRPYSETAATQDHHDMSYIEFYCGIGGWTMALKQAAAATTHQPRCVAALDHSDLCTRVFEHNHQHKIHKTVQIEKLTVEQLVQWSADIFLMSPPCQPHSRQHDNQEQDLEDPRSRSFLHLCGLLEKVPSENLPKLVLLENVVGFESSSSRRRWMEALQQREYNTGEFHLSPTQVGIPNDRPRYYCLAVKSSSCLATKWQNDFSFMQPADPKAKLSLVTSISELNVQPPTEESTSSSSSPRPNSSTATTIHALDKFLDPQLLDNCADDLRVPRSILERNAAWCFDLVTSKSTRSACFTSSYGKYVKGTGSVIYTGLHPDKVALARPQDRSFDQEWQQGLDLNETNLRYFSGEELARLFGFDKSFSFPTKITRKQQWKLMGNSLNVAVASKLVELGLRLISKD